jgi:hypothetical protein
MASCGKGTVFFPQIGAFYMPNIVDITVQDEALANHVYEAKQTTPHAEWREDKVTVVGSPKVSASLTPPGTSKYEKVKVVFSYPVESTVDGVTTVQSKSYAEAVFRIDQNMTDTDRADFGGLFINLLKDAAIKQYFKLGDIAY